MPQLASADRLCSQAAALVHQTLRGYLTLLRPANVATALADVLAGYALGGISNPHALAWLLTSTAGLYAGGVVLNDYFDRDLDRFERPERPIPSGRIPAGHAAALGAILLTSGTLSAAQAGRMALLVALAIAVLVVAYDVWGKRHSSLAPVNMGLCRGLNLLLGAAVAPAALAQRWSIAAIPFAYIVAVTALSRGEVHGGNRRAATFALVSLTAALSSLAVVVVRSEQVLAGVVWMALAWRVVPPFLAARHTPEPLRIRYAVRRGVLSLVLVNAVIGTAYGGPFWGAVILSTGLLAGLLARAFPVT